MRFTLLTVIPALVVACSTSRSDQTVASTDSVSIDSSQQIAPVSQPEDSAVSSPAANEENINNDSLATLLSQKTEAIDDIFKTKIDTYLTLNINLSGYEYSSDITWYFDTLFNLTGYYEDWSMEGTSGTRHAYFDQDQLIAAKDLDNAGDSEVTTFACLNFPALTQTSGDEFTYQLLPDNHLATRETELRQQLRQTLQKIGAENPDTSDEMITVTVENNVDIGEMNVTEKAEYTLAKKLLEALSTANF